MKRIYFPAIAAVFMFVLLSPRSSGQASKPVAEWSFDGNWAAWPPWCIR
jgi:hypothetical protein